MIDAETDVSSLVNSAFDESECASRSKDVVPCGGPHRAYSTTAHCGGGLLCENHYKHYVDTIRPRHVSLFEKNGYIRCSYCKVKVYSLDGFSKVYPL